MRISDWSSDVCSSDLCRKSCLRDSVGQTAQQFIDRGLRSRLRVDLLDDHRAVQRMRAILRWQLAGHHHAVRRHRTVAHLAGRAVVDARALAEDRSEEHTSELQSLMRISSAVFCLKKKTN